MLAAARARLRRLTPAEAAAAVRAGRILVDTRDGDVRDRDGRIPGAVHIPLSVLEWRGDPAPGDQSAALPGHQDDLLLICHQGSSSSPPAVRLPQLGDQDN